MELGISFFFCYPHLNGAQPRQWYFFLLSSPKWGKQGAGEQGSREAGKQASKQASNQPRVRIAKKIISFRLSRSFFCCYPHLRLALQLGYSQPSAFQATAGEDSKKNTFPPLKVFFCYPHPRLAPHPAWPMPQSQPSALQAAAGEDSKKNCWRRKSLLFLLSSPAAA